MMPRMDPVVLRTVLWLSPGILLVGILGLHPLLAFLPWWA